jgi:hypothetical protein
MASKEKQERLHGLQVEYDGNGQDEVLLEYVLTFEI